MLTRAFIRPLFVRVFCKHARPLEYRLTVELFGGSTADLCLTLPFFGGQIQQAAYCAERVLRLEGEQSVL